MNLVSEWKLDEASGTTAYDSWGPNNGTLSGATLPSIQTSGCISGNCLSFNGSTAYVDCGTDSSLDVGYNNYTFSLWFKRNTFGTTQVLLDKRVSEYVGLILFFSSNNLLYSRGGASGHDITFSSAITDDRWHFVVVSNTRSGNRIIGVDGVFQSSSYDSSSINFNSTYSLKIGTIYTATSFYFNGRIDDIRIYNQAMPISQIQQNYYSGLNKLLARNGFDVVEYSQRLGELKLNLAKHE